MSVVPEHSVELADQEAKSAADNLQKHIEKISRLAEGIEELLFKEDACWADWREVVDVFNRRNEIVMPQIKMKEIKDRYANSPA